MTTEEIYEQMVEAMPYPIHSMVKPYILEAMKLYANSKLDEAADKASIKGIPNMGGYLKMVDRDSILKLKDQI